MSRAVYTDRSARVRVTRGSTDGGRIALTVHTYGIQ
jgi:hypothetical protein